MKLKYIVLDESVKPYIGYKQPGDAGFDLMINSFKVYKTYILATTGIAVEIPKGYVGFIVPRSSSEITLSNTMGIIDAGYRGELKLKINKTNINLLERPLVQLVVTPCITKAEEVNKLSDSERGNKGFGSTDNNVELKDEYSI